MILIFIVLGVIDIMFLLIFLEEILMLFKFDI